MLLNYSALLDLKDNSSLDNIRCVIGDGNVYRLNVLVALSGQIVDLTGHTARITFVKPDGHVVWQDMTIDDATSGSMYCVFENQVYAVEGIIQAEIELYDNGTNRLTTATFTLTARRGLLDDSAVESSSEFTALDDALEAVQGFDSIKSEIVTARGGYASLGARLTALDNINSQMAEKANQEDLDTVNTNLQNTKADKTYVDSKVASVASGSPDKTFATLTDLNTAYPTGDSKNKLVASDGHIYNWNGSVWTDTGIQYQSTGIADKSVTPLQTSFFKTKDKVDFIIKNGYKIVSDTTTHIVPDPDYYCLMFHRSDAIAFFFDLSQLSINKGVVTDSNFVQQTGMAVYSLIYPCLMGGFDDYVVLSYPNAVTSPSFKFVLPHNYDNFDESFSDLLSSGVIERGSNQFDANYALDNYRYLYGLFIEDPAYILTNPIDINGKNKVYLPNWLNAHSQALFFDDTFKLIKTLDPPTGVSVLSGTFLYTDGIISSVFDFSSDPDLANARFLILEIQKTDFTAWDINKMYVSTDRALNILVHPKVDLADQYAFPYSDKMLTQLGDSITINCHVVYHLYRILRVKGYSANGIGGTRISGTDANAFWQDNRVNSIDGQTDALTIMGGTNDLSQGATMGAISLDNSDINTFVGAYNVLLSKIYYKFLHVVGYYSGVTYTGVTQTSVAKELPIVLITPPKLFDTVEKMNLSKDFSDVVKEIGKLWGLPVIDINSKAGFNILTKDLYFNGATDYTHPTDYGSQKLARIISKELVNMNLFG